jgi:hypothetical protein
VPGATRTAQDFAQDDSFCRRHSSFGSAEAAAATGQGQPVDYLQCMAARGDIITEARSPAITVTYLSYPTTDPWSYFDWGWWLGFGPAWGGPDPRGRPEAGPVGRPAIGGSPFPPGGN